MTFRYRDESNAPLPPEIEAVGELVLDAAYVVHSRLGPGLLESNYRQSLAIEIRERGGRADEEVSIPVSYAGVPLGVGFRVDIIVNRCVAIEVKAVDAIHLIHRQQLQSYLKHANLPLGYLLNFHTPRLRRGIRRHLNSRALPSDAVTWQLPSPAPSPSSLPSPSSGVDAAPKSQPSEQAEKCD